MDTDIWMPFFRFWFPESTTLWLYLAIMLVVIGYGSIILYQLIILRKKEEFLMQVKSINELDLLDRVLFSGIFGLLSYFFSIFLIRTLNLLVNLFSALDNPFLDGAPYSLALSVITAVLMIYLNRDKEIIWSVRSAIIYLFLIDMACFFLFYWLISVSIILVRPLDAFFVTNPIMSISDAYLGFIVITGGAFLLYLTRRRIYRIIAKMF